MSYMQDNIRHVVHLMLENRSFDSLLGWLRWNGVAKPNHHVPPLRHGEREFYGLTGGEWQPSNASYFTPEGPFSYKREMIRQITPDSSWDYCEMPASDPGEEYEHVAKQLWSRDGGPPMGFYLDYLGVYALGSPRDILGVFVPETLPCLNALAERFAVSDMWFSSVPTQTNPNRAFSICGTSMGRINNNDDVNTYKLCDAPYAGVNTIFSVFNSYNQNNPAKPPIRWKVYARWNWHDVAREPTHPLTAGWDSWHAGKEAGRLCFEATKGKYFTEYMFPRGFENRQWGGTATIDDFKRDVARNTLPDFSYLEPAFFPQSLLLEHLTDYHPPESVFAGEEFVKDIFDTLTSNPEVWSSTLLIITFDEHGGTYDHLMPPANALPPDAHANDGFDFRRYGVRVPTLLISPWVAPGTVFRAGYYPETGDPNALPFDHTSVLATLCQWKGIDCRDEAGHPEYYLGARTAAAPTFEDVITDVSTLLPVKLTPHECSTGLVAFVKRRELIRAMTRGIAELLKLSEAEIAERGIVLDILDACKTASDLIAHLESLLRDPSNRKG